MDLRDKYDRSFKTLRVSLTNVCNLGCIYCIHSGDQKLKNDSNKVIGYKDIVLAIQKIHELSPLETVRLTGGEPTLYKELISVIEGIRSVGIKNIKMTSNGYLLKEMVPELSNAGLKKINISLDAVTTESFNKMSGRKNLDKVLDAIDESLRYGIEVKINAVILKGINDDQILPLLNYSQQKNISIRFLELMKMGPLYNSEEFKKHFFSESEILDTIRENISFAPLLRNTSDTANYWITEDGHKFGIIANESSPFCHDCNRLRLDSYGKIYGCLSNDSSISIIEDLNNKIALKQKLEEALSHKQELKFTGSAISMMAIGG